MTPSKTDLGTAQRAARYLKIVQWSDEDQCFIGTCPGLFAGGVHGDKEADVMAELCQAVLENIEIYEEEGRALPPPTAGRKYSGKFVVRMPPRLHELATINAMAAEQSLNDFIVKSVRAATGALPSI